MAKAVSNMLDLVFAMDCTGSMDPYIEGARDNIETIVNDVVEGEKCDIKLALVEYRDHPQDDTEDFTFVTRTHDFTDSAVTMKEWLLECDANGGDDTPEAVADALNDVLHLSWRAEATKMCVFITDAPPHGLEMDEDEETDSFPDGCPLGLDPMNLARELAGVGVSLYVVGCEPSVTPYKDFYLALAHVTGGQYVPLTEANGLVKIIIIGSREEISLKKLEVEVENEIKAALSSGMKINEEELSSSLHKRWKQRGEKTKQLSLNEKGLETASSSLIAMKMSKMDFNDAKALFSSSSKEGKSEAKESGGNNAEKDMEMEEKLAKATSVLDSLKPGGKVGSKPLVKVDLSGLTTQVDFGPAEEQSVDGTEWQCIDGGVTLSQTMRLVQRSLNKLSK